MLYTGDLKAPVTPSVSNHARPMFEISLSSPRLFLMQGPNMGSRYGRRRTPVGLKWFYVVRGLSRNFDCIYVKIHLSPTGGSHSSKESSNCND